MPKATNFQKFSSQNEAIKNHLYIIAMYIQIMRKAPINQSSSAITENIKSP